MSDPLFVLAAVVLTVLFLGVFAAIIYLGGLPGKIARARNHPQAEAINAASWLGLALAGVGWPIAFVWAFWNHAAADKSSDEGAREIADLPKSEIGELVKRVDRLEQQLAAVRTEDKA